MDYNAEKIELKKLFNYFMYLANKRVAWAQTWIADAYFWGWGVDKDFNQFLAWDIRAARKGSYVSRKRMMLYYQSFGDADAVVELNKISPIPTVLSIHKDKPSTEVEAEYEDVKSNTLLPYELIRDISELGKLSVLEFIDQYEKLCSSKSNSVNCHGEAALLRAICYIYGFGVNQDFEKAMKILVENDSTDLMKRAEPQEVSISERVLFYRDNFDALHYYQCLREKGIPGSESLESLLLDENIKLYFDVHDGSKESVQAVYNIRHKIRKAFEGDRMAAKEIGFLLLEEVNKFDARGRRLIYHDDLCALSYLKMLSGIEANSSTTIKVLQLTSDPSKKTFDKAYADQLFKSIESRLEKIPVERPEKDFEHYDRNYVIYKLVECCINFARVANDLGIKKEFGNKAIILSHKVSDGRLNDFLMGEICYECFMDYQSALAYYDKNYGNQPNAYSQKCRDRLAGR